MNRCTVRHIINHTSCDGDCGYSKGGGARSRIGGWEFCLGFHYSRKRAWIVPEMHSSGNYLFMADVARRVRAHAKSTCRNFHNSHNYFFFHLRLHIAKSSTTTTELYKLNARRRVQMIYHKSQTFNSTKFNRFPVFDAIISIICESTLAHHRLHRLKLYQISP